MIGPITRVQVRYSGRLDATAWANRHAAGDVPDHLPYGLDRLGDSGIDVAVAPPLSAGRGRAQMARLARGIGHLEWLEVAQSDRRRADADVCLCWDELSGIPSVLRGHLPVVTGVIALTDRGRAYQRTFAAALRRAHQVWSLSTGQLPALRELGVPQQRLHHLLFGIDADFFTPDETPVVPGLVVTAGNDQHRDHPTAVRAMAIVARQLGHTRLEMASRHQVEVPAHLGVRHPMLSHSDLRALYRRSQVVIVALKPNLHVSGVTVALEAMACGRPVIATATPGMEDYVAHGQWGLLVPAGDADALAAAVIRLLDDPDEAAAFGAAGHKAVQDAFSTQVQARRLAEILRS